MLKTLVITSDTQLVDNVEPALRRLEFEMDLKPTVVEGIHKMRYERYCAVLVDSGAGSIEQIDESRGMWLKRDSTVIAITPQGATTYDRFPGADAVWTQPLIPWEVHRTLLNLRSRETCDRRLRARYAPTRETPLRYSYDGIEFHEASILDLTETGVAIEGAEAMSNGNVVYIEFKLPAMLNRIQTAASVVWRTERRAGLHFVGLPENQQRQLERWLRQARLGMSTGHTTFSYAAGY